MRCAEGMRGRAARAVWSARAVRLTVSALLMQCLVSDVPARAGLKSTLHYASNGNFSPNGSYLPGAVGFNLADVSKLAQLNSLPDGVKGLVWVGQCKGVDARFLNTVRPYIGNAKLFGFYLMDDPDPTGVHRPLCKADDLKAESDWVHANVPGAKTFILLMQMSSSKTPSFIGTYNPNNSHVDLFGIDPYPCRTELKDCDYDAIERYVAAAESWGVPRDSMVPVYQAFGGGNWVNDGGGRYALPTVSQLQQILARWQALVPTPVFDFVYSWGSQNADVALDRSPDLQAVFRLRNRKFSDRLPWKPVAREARR
jgi:hypothetical protein